MIIKNQKPYFFQRLIAYGIDMLIVSLLCISINFILPENKNFQKYSQEYAEIQTNFYQTNMDMQEYINKSADVVYDMDYSNVMSSIISVVILILYFSVFQFYNGGQTIGKKIMRIRLASVEGELTLNQVTYRSFIINNIFISLLLLSSVLFIGRKYYFYISLSLQFIYMLIVFIILMMILIRKDNRGFHDLLTKTEVVKGR